MMDRSEVLEILFYCIFCAKTYEEFIAEVTKQLKEVWVQHRIEQGEPIKLNVIGRGLSPIIKLPPIAKEDDT